MAPGPAPEDVVIDADGSVWTGCADGKIARIDGETGSNEVVGDTGGRPLGLAVARDGKLLVCDSHRGLLRGYLTPALFEAGLYCRADDRGDPVVQLAPPLISGPAEFDEIYQILHRVLGEASRLL